MLRALTAPCHMCLFLLPVPVCPKLNRIQPSSPCSPGLLLPWLVGVPWFACSRVSPPFIAPGGGRTIAMSFTASPLQRTEVQRDKQRPPSSSSRTQRSHSFLFSSGNISPKQTCFLDKEGLPVQILHTHSYFSCWDACNFIFREGTRSLASLA